MEVFILQNNMKDLKLKPYDKLRSIFNEGELTQRGSDNLNDILEIKEQKKENFLNKIISLFKKFDSWIFKKSGNKMWNTTYYKRKR